MLIGTKKALRKAAGKYSEVESESLNVKLN